MLAVLVDTVVADVGGHVLLVVVDVVLLVVVGVLLLVLMLASYKKRKYTFCV